jgi:hypothetical protein
MAQPSMKSDKGVVATVGIQIGSDRTALVMPIATSDIAVTKDTLCSDAASAFAALVTSADFLKLIPDSAYISYVQCEGMDDGVIPERFDYSTTAHVGTGGDIGPPPSVGVLTTFYAEHADLPAGTKMRHSRMTIPGVPATYIVGGILTSIAKAFYQLIADKLVNGFDNSQQGAATWYRVLSAPPPKTQGGLPATDLIRLADFRVRWYMGTQKKRILPHG